jgi:hypothetical protein
MIMKPSMQIMSAVLLLGASCARSNQAARPEDMTAAEHRAAAERESSAAAQAASQPEKYLYPRSVYAPSEEPLLEANKHLAHSQRHLAEAHALEAFERAECAGFPPRTRAACPLLSSVVAIEDIPAGVRVRMAPRVRVDAVVAHMRCHYAYASAHAFADAVSCPLYIRDIEIKASDDRAGVEITAHSEAGARHVRARAREQAIFVKKQ